MPTWSIAPDRTVSATKIERGPDDAVIGMPYPFDLYIHCGGSFAWFASQTWQTSTPPGEHAGQVDPSETVVSSAQLDYLAGWMILESEQTSLLRQAGTSKVVVYQRTDEDPPACA